MTSVQEILLTDYMIKSWCCKVVPYLLEVEAFPLLGTRTAGNILDIYQFWDLLYISSMTEAGNLKFGTQIDPEEFWQKYAKLGQRRSEGVTWHTY